MPQKTGDGVMSVSGPFTPHTQKPNPREESGSYSIESSYQFKYLDRPANDPILLDLLPVNQPAFLIE